MNDMPLKVGETVTFTKTVSETDVYLFAGITGDFSPAHVNEEHMKNTPYKHRIAHGVLSLGYSSTASTLMGEKAGLPCVSYGYDRIRFINPVYIGDTLTVKYTVKGLDAENLKSFNRIEIYNQSNELCTVGEHILKFFNES